MTTFIWQRLEAFFDQRQTTRFGDNGSMVESTPSPRHDNLRVHGIGNVMILKVEIITNAI